MTTQVLTAIQQKGGTGKTTILCMLASLMAEDGARVAIVDADPQESAADFAEAAEAAGLALDYLQETDEDKIVPTVKALAKAEDHDIILIDTAGIASRITDYAIHLADLVFVPVKPARPDVKGLVKSLKAIERVEAIKERSIPAYMIYSDVDARTRITATWSDELKKLETPMLDTPIYHRTGLREFMSTAGRLQGPARRVARQFLAELQTRDLLKFYHRAAQAAE